MPTEDAPVLEIRNLTKQFGQTAAVQDVCEAFRRGEYFCILGPSGCGKSTLLRLIAGLAAPTSGEILLEGRPIADVPPERRDVNMVFQNYALFPHMTVYENVAFGLKMKKHPKEAIAGKVQEALRLVGLEAQAQRRPAQLSGGQQQRVALARAAVNRPLVLLLDEPLSALDKNLRLSMQDELRRIQREIGITFLHVTHDQGEAFSMADRVAIMRDGWFIQVGPPQEIYQRPASRFAAEFLGSSNLLDATVAPEGLPWICLHDALRLRVAADPGRVHGREGLTAFIRPEKIEMHLQPPPVALNAVEARLVRVKYAGSEVACTAQAGRVQFLVHALNRGASMDLREGDRVFLSIAPEDIFLLPPEEPGASPQEAG